MRPDRVIIGEVRGPEAFDMLQAMNTGHEGSMSTIHANNPAMRSAGWSRWSVWPVCQ
ncbi:ATPase, T2SS/T4P/T4SS family [Sulfitobacter aestuariivivens]